MDSADLNNQADNLIALLDAILERIETINAELRQAIKLVNGEAARWASKN